MNSGVTLQEIRNLFNFLEQSKTNNDMQIIIDNSMCKALYDLCVNLEKYNEKLKEENEDKDNKILELQQELLSKKLNIKDIEYKEKMIYKSRNEKAIEYIKNNLSLGVDTFGSVYSIGANKVLNILSGGE